MGGISESGINAASVEEGMHVESRRSETEEKEAVKSVGEHDRGTMTGAGNVENETKITF